MITTGLNIHAYKGADVDIEIFVVDQNDDAYEFTGSNYLRVYTRFEKTSFLDIPLTWSTDRYIGSLTNSQTSLLTAIEYKMEWLTINGTDYSFPVKGSLWVSDVFTTQTATAADELTVNTETTTISISKIVNSPIDTALSATSTNPVQNKVVTAGFTKENITGIKLADSPEFANSQIATLKSDADDGAIPAAQATWLGATAKSVISYILNILSKLYTHITATANAHPASAISHRSSNVADRIDGITEGDVTRDIGGNLTSIITFGEATGFIRDAESNVIGWEDATHIRMIKYTAAGDFDGWTLTEKP